MSNSPTRTRTLAKVCSFELLDLGEDLSDSGDEYEDARSTAGLSDSTFYSAPAAGSSRAPSTSGDAVELDDLDLVGRRDDTLGGDHTAPDIPAEEQPSLKRARPCLPELPANLVIAPGISAQNPRRSPRCWHKVAAAHSSSCTAAAEQQAPCLVSAQLSILPGGRVRLLLAPTANAPEQLGFVFGCDSRAPTWLAHDDVSQDLPDQLDKAGKQAASTPKKGPAGPGVLTVGDLLVSRFPAAPGTASFRTDIMAFPIMLAPSPQAHRGREAAPPAPGSGTSSLAVSPREDLADAVHMMAAALPAAAAMAAAAAASPRLAKHALGGGGTALDELVKALSAAAAASGDGVVTFRANRADGGPLQQPKQEPLMPKAAAQDTEPADLAQELPAVKAHHTVLGIVRKLVPGYGFTEPQQAPEDTTGADAEQQEEAGARRSSSPVPSPEECLSPVLSGEDSEELGGPLHTLQEQEQGSALRPEEDAEDGGSSPVGLSPKAAAVPGSPARPPPGSSFAQLQLSDSNTLRKSQQQQQPTESISFARGSVCRLLLSNTVSGLFASVMVSEGGSAGGAPPATQAGAALPGAASLDSGTEETALMCAPITEEEQPRLDAAADEDVVGADAAGQALALAAGTEAEPQVVGSGADTAPHSEEPAANEDADAWSNLPSIGADAVSFRKRKAEVMVFPEDEGHWARDAPAALKAAMQSAELGPMMGLGSKKADVQVAEVQETEAEARQAPSVDAVSVGDKAVLGPDSVKKRVACYFKRLLMPCFCPKAKQWEL